MKKKQVGSLAYYTFDLLDPYPNLHHGVLTRKWQDRDLNLASKPLDLEALTAAEKALDLPPASFVMQVHGTKALLLDPEQIYQPRSPEALLSGYDALITQSHHTLLIKLADCQGILLFDPQSQTLALIHSGWRGSVANIIGRTVGRLETELNISPGNILAAISPSLGPCCAEFIHFREEFPPEFHDFRDPTNDHFDFWAISRHQLMMAGLKSENIEIAGICTRCSSEFFSHRRGDLGRFGIMAGLTRPAI